MSWYVYVLRCGDGTLYTGITTDLDRRIREHNEGTGSRYTAARRPVTLLHQETAPDRSTAARREIAVKRMPRAAKLALVRSGSAP